MELPVAPESMPGQLSWPNQAVNGLGREPLFFEKFGGLGDQVMLRFLGAVDFYGNLGTSLVYYLDEIGNLARLYTSICFLSARS